MRRARPGEGRKIDEFFINEKRAVLRMDFHHEFTLEVDGLSLKGTDAKALEREAEVAIAGLAELVWEKVAVVRAELTSDFGLDLRRFFMAMRKKERFFREWLIDGRAESWGDKHPDRVDGEPGSITKPHFTLDDRIVPYTPELWRALLKLYTGLSDFVQAARERIELSLGLPEGELPAWIAMAADMAPEQLFAKGKQES